MRLPSLRRAASDALTSAHPRHRYRVGFDAKYIFPVLVKLPTFITDYIYLLSNLLLPSPAALQRR